MYKSLLLLTCLVCIANAFSPAISLLSSSGISSDVYNDWSNYYKRNDAKLDSVLAKCYECIEKKSGYHENTVCSDFTGLNTITAEGVVNAGTSFLNGAHTSYSPSYGYSQVNTYNYGGKSYNPYAQSLSCMVGNAGTSATTLDQTAAVPIACEYGQSYCKVVFPAGDNAAVHFYGCAAVCIPSALEICTTGTLSNKLGPMCLVGSLASGVPFAPAFQCDLGNACSFNIATQTAACSPACVPSATVLCSFSDYGNKLGPLCYVGKFDTDAELKGCGGTIVAGVVTPDFCLVYTSVTGAGTFGVCSSSPNLPAGIPADAVKVLSTQIDMGNKQGPICFVGQFGNDATATACSKGKLCQRETHITDGGFTQTFGACVTTCTPSVTTFCCSTDLCNTYHSDVNYEVRELPEYGDYQKSSYFSSGYGSNNGYNKQMY
jgi:hypothetical protein